MAAIALLALIAQPAALTLPATVDSSQQEDPQAECDLLAEAASIEDHLPARQVDLVIQDSLEQADVVCLDHVQTPVPIDDLLEEIELVEATG